jgi:choline oxidase
VRARRRRMRSWKPPAFTGRFADKAHEDTAPSVCARFAGVDATFDYVVLGGGTAGSVVAARLAEDPSITVCLVEAGPSDEGLAEILDVQRWPEFPSRLDWDYETENTIGDETIRTGRARVLGGCSSHNLAIAYRAPDADLRAWERLGATGWSPETCRTYFDRVFAKTGLEWAPTTSEVAQAFIEGCRQAGFPDLPAIADGSSEGAGRTSLNSRDLMRRSASIGYLHPLASLPANLEVRLETYAYRVLIEEGTAVGAETSSGILNARREVIVCEGAFESPKLLMLSGIGPAQQLRSFGIEVKADLPVGAGLVDHLAVAVTFRTPRPFTQPRTTYYDAVLLANTAGDDGAPPDLMLWLVSLPTGTDQEPSESRSFDLTPQVTHPRSEGWVRLRSDDPMDPPVINYGYLNDPEGSDLARLVKGLELARRIAAQPALEEWIEEETDPGPSGVSEPELREYARATSASFDHPVATCRIGSVVDPELRVLGIRGLRVADASVFPDTVGVNPFITVMMIGERCADLIRSGR